MEFDLIIVGGGLAGLSLAAALRSSALRVAVVEAAAPRRPEGWDARIYAYSPASARFLGDIGVWPHLDASRVQPVHEMKVFGDRGGEIGFSAYDSGLAELAWIGESSLVHEELWQGVRRQHNVTLFCPGSPHALQVDAHGVVLGLIDGKVLRARLLVAADGVNSWVRERVGIQARFRPYQEMAVVANFRTEADHAGTAFQWFRPDGILAYLPLPGRLMSMVWSAPDAVAQELMSLSPAALCERVAEAGGHRLGALELVSAAAAFPLRMMRVEKVVRDRVALIGDAAHAIHPLSGHGINLGFEDARELAALLVGLPSWQDPGDLSVLRRYARARAEEPFVLQYATHGLNRLFSADIPAVAALRNAGLNLTGRLPVLRNMLVRYAANGRF